MERLIVNVVGNPDCGKSSACRSLAKELGFAVATPSMVIEDYAKEKGITLSGRPDYHKTHMTMLEERGNSYMVDSLLAVSESDLCIDGLRVLEYMMQFKKMGAISVAMWCPFETRRQRALARADDKDSMKRETFAREEAAEYEASAPYNAATITLMQMADYHIDASGPEEIVHQELRHIVTQLLA